MWLLFFFFLGIETELSVLKCIYKKKNLFFCGRKVGFWLLYHWENIGSIFTELISNSLYLGNDLFARRASTVAHPVAMQCTVLQRIWFSENWESFVSFLGQEGAEEITRNRRNLGTESLLWLWLQPLWLCRLSREREKKVWDFRI